MQAVSFQIMPGILSGLSGSRAPQEPVADDNPRLCPFVTLSASIDCGANTFRLLIADSAPAATLTPLRCERIITRLGEDFHLSGALSVTACRRSIEALHAFMRIITAYRITDVHAVATAVVREAANGEAFINDILRQTGISVKVLSGSEEAHFRYGAASGFALTAGTI